MSGGGDGFEGGVSARAEGGGVAGARLGGRVGRGGVRAAWDLAGELLSVSAALLGGGACGVGAAFAASASLPREDRVGVGGGDLCAAPPAPAVRRAADPRRVEAGGDD